MYRGTTVIRLCEDNLSWLSPPSMQSSPLDAVFLIFVLSPAGRMLVRSHLDPVGGGPVGGGSVGLVILVERYVGPGRRPAHFLETFLDNARREAFRVLEKFRCTILSYGR